MFTWKKKSSLKLKSRPTTCGDGWTQQSVRYKSDEGDHTCRLVGNILLSHWLPRQVQNI